MRTILLFLLITISLSAQDYKLEWSSYIGGEGKEFIEAVVNDEYGNIYIFGYTNSYDFPTTDDAFQKTLGGASDLFLMKFTKDMKLVWSTLIGGYEAEFPKYAKCGKDCIWLVGESRSGNFPVTPNAYQSYLIDDNDGAILKFSLDGKLLYSSYIGSNGYDVVDDIAIDNEENIWLTGRVLGSDFKTTKDAEQKTNLSGADSYIAKFDKDGQILYCSYLGGNRDDYAMDIAYNKNSNIIAITGYTDSYDFPIRGNAIFPSKIAGNSAFDSFVCYFNMKGELIYSTFFGGAGTDYAEHITEDNQGGFYFRSFTSSRTILTNYNTFQKENPGIFSSYIARINENGEMVWGSFYGGSGTDAMDNINNKGGGLSVDMEGNVVISGFTNSDDLPVTHDAFQTSKKSREDAYVCKFNKNGKLQYSSFFGGSGSDDGRDILISGNKIYVAGWTGSKDFPVMGEVLSDSISGFQDAFLSVFEAEVLECRPVINSDEGFTTLPLKINKNITDNSYVHLNDFEPFDKGYMFCTKEVDASYGFESNFSFTVSHGVVKIENPRLTGDGGFLEGSLPGADGIAFVIAGELPNSGSESGGGIGYAGIPNAIAIEIDLYQNDGNNDPNGNHLAIQIPDLSGKLSPVHNLRNTLLMKENILEISSDSSAVYYCKVRYVHNSLQVFLDTNESFGAPVAVINNLKLSDFISMQNNAVSFLGLTASTGQSVELHTITHWDICSYLDPFLSVEDGYSGDSGHLLVYPNPTEDFINISLPKGKIYRELRVVLTDLLGKRLMDEEYSSISQLIQLPVYDLAKGLYNCQVLLDGREVYRAQFIKK
jgi:hypothetical protein